MVAIAPSRSILFTPKTLLRSYSIAGPQDPQKIPSISKVSFFMPLPSGV